MVAVEDLEWAHVDETHPFLNSERIDTVDFLLEKIGALYGLKTSLFMIIKGLLSND